VLLHHVASTAEAGVDFSKWNLLSYRLEIKQFAHFQLPGLQLQVAKLLSHTGWWNFFLISMSKYVINSLFF